MPLYKLKEIKQSSPCLFLHPYKLIIFPFCNYILIACINYVHQFNHHNKFTTERSDHEKKASNIKGSSNAFRKNKKTNGNEA